VEKDDADLEGKIGMGEKVADARLVVAANADGLSTRRHASAAGCDDLGLSHGEGVVAADGGLLGRNWSLLYYLSAGNR